MPFNEDPYAQARAEVANKSMGSQIANSSMFHSVRSAFSSKGSAGSKGLGVALSVGKLFLALIPVPIVGAVVGAVADGINGKVRGGIHDYKADKAKARGDHETYAKFAIKELTVENLDRYRWKVAHSFEELNQGITAYNGSTQGCDDLYAFALLYEQVQRRKKILREELGKFSEVLEAVNAWILKLENEQQTELDKVKNKINKRMEEEATALSMQSLFGDVSALKAEHAGCKLWCYCKGEAKYNPSETMGSFKKRAGQVANFLKPIAVSSIAVRQSDYTSNSDNSKFTN